ncbi:MAG: carboxypeptidase regulatory-like domain-containing protein [Fibrobacter sp.]|jgi:hypothetical protein|nr:carboxypeptidase regulatory-like domain-containing protein [Fibrobacter sp.]
MKIIMLLSGLFTMFFCLCGNNVAGSETTNGDQIIVIASKGSIYGTAPVGHTIYLFSSDYCPYNDSGFSSTAIADSSGAFSFNNLEIGEYAVYCKLADSDLSVFVKLMLNRSDGWGIADTVFAFGENGSFSGKLTDATGVPLSLYDVYIPGSPFFTVTDSSGGFVIDSVPEGNYRVYFSKSSNDINSPTKSRKIIEVTIEAGKKTVVDPVTF